MLLEKKVQFGDFKNSFQKTQHNKNIGHEDELNVKVYTKSKPRGIKTHGGPGFEA